MSIRVSTSKHTQTQTSLIGKNLFRKDSINFTQAVTQILEQEMKCSINSDELLIYKVMRLTKQKSFNGEYR